MSNMLHSRCEKSQASGIKTWKHRKYRKLQAIYIWDIEPFQPLLVVISSICPSELTLNLLFWLHLFVNMTLLQNREMKSALN